MTLESLVQVLTSTLRADANLITLKTLFLSLCDGKICVNKQGKANNQRCLHTVAL
jgi:hypothetical protein